MSPQAGPRASDDAPLKPYRTILTQEVEQATEELDRPVTGLAVSGCLAGFGVSVSLLLMAVLHTVAADTLAPPVLTLLAANLYAVGFVIVILARTDLFTEYTTIAILPVLTRDASLGALGRLWALIYAGNLVGVTAFAVLTVLLGPRLEIVAPEVLETLAREVVRHPWWVLLLSATLAGWLIGLLSWLVIAGRDTTSQIVFIWLVTGTIGLGRLHHAIMGAAEIIAAILVGRGTTVADLGDFLVRATLGNALGGAVFAVLIKSSLAMPRRPGAGRGRRASHRGGQKT
jgi:formate-nitrite transporter family protein